MQSITISVIIPILNVTSSDFEKCLTNIETQNRLQMKLFFLSKTMTLVNLFKKD